MHMHMPTGPFHLSLAWSIAVDTHIEGIELPMGIPAWITSELVAETIDVWQPHYEEELTVEDAVEIVNTVGRLADLSFVEAL